MTYQNLLLEQPEPGVYLLTVNRPQALNALNAATLNELGDAAARVGTDSGARVLLITGAGDKAFVAGADIAAMQALTVDEARTFSATGMQVMRALEALPVPVIALVNGYALGGGCELALACDWIIASERAVFGQPEVSLGIPPGFGGTQRLLRLVGRARAGTGEHRAANQGCGSIGHRLGRRGRAGGPPGGTRAGSRAADCCKGAACRALCQTGRSAWTGHDAGRGVCAGVRIVRAGLRQRGSARGHARVSGQASTGIYRALNVTPQSLPVDGRASVLVPSINAGKVIWRCAPGDLHPRYLPSRCRESAGS